MGWSVWSLIDAVANWKSCDHDCAYDFTLTFFVCFMVSEGLNSKQPGRSNIREGFWNSTREEAR